MLAYMLLITSFLITNVLFGNQNPGILIKKNILSLKEAKDKDYGLKASFLYELQKLTNATVFIESGTYYGNTTNRASNYFNTVHTIELDQNLHTKALKRFKEKNNVHIHGGDSAQILKQILPNIKEKILFWLDGHYSGHGTAKGTCNTPILGELEAIKNFGIHNAIILVDDIRCFQTIPNIPINEPFFGYPTIQKLKNAILDINKNYEFKIYGDIAIAYLPNKHFTVSTIVNACTISYLGEPYYSENEIIEAEQIIAGVQGEEKQVLQQLHKLFIGSEKHGFCKFFRLWNGLILRNNHHYQQAQQQFKQARILGLEEKRITPYL